jgi:aminoglycoside phosphotransferase (APT) family kinase protein
MINPDYTVEEIETRFMSFLKKQVGDLEITEHLNQIKGGNEAYLYRFHVKGVKGMETPQVLRLFPGFYGDEKAEWEAMIQNMLNERGLPTPKAHISTRDMTVLGGSFLVMDYIDGITPDPLEDLAILGLTARTQSKLHQIDGKPVSEAIHALGHSRHSHSIEGRIDWLLDRAKHHPELKELFKWVVDNKPELPEKVSVVHGDFHPGNMILKDGEVIAIVDWSGFMVGDPMAGLGWTLALYIGNAKHDFPPEVFEDLIQGYIQEYEKISPVNKDTLAYFITFRLAMALLEGLDGQTHWTQPQIVNTILSELKDRTGISVKLLGL